MQRINIKQIKVKKEYLDLVPRMKPDDDKVFDEAIKNDGVTEPVRITPQKLLLDGHSRLAKARKYYDITAGLISDSEVKLIELKTALEETELTEKIKSLKDEIAWWKNNLKFKQLALKLYETVPYETKSFKDKLLEKRYVIECNLARRHLTNFQKARLGIPLLEIEQKLAKQRQKLTLKQNQPKVPLGSNDPNDKNYDDTKSTAIVAKKVGISGTTMMRAKLVIEQGNEDQKKKLDEGKTSINSIYHELTRKTRNLPKVKLPDGKWSVAMCDFPIQFKRSGIRGASTNNYDTITLEELKTGIINGEDVNKLFNDDCVLFAWFQATTIFDAKEILEAWGFTPITNIVWDKKRIGTGYWLKNRHEHLVIATKGHMPLPAVRLESVQEVPPSNRKHSSKPVKFYDSVEQCYPDRKYLDLFSRYKHNDNWTCFGNEFDNGKEGSK